MGAAQRPNLRPGEDPRPGGGQAARDGGADHARRRRPPGLDGRRRDRPRVPRHGAAPRRSRARGGHRRPRSREAEDLGPGRGGRARAGSPPAGRSTTRSPGGPCSSPSSSPGSPVSTTLAAHPDFFVASSLRSFSREDIPAVLDLSRRAFGRPEEQVGNPLWASLRRARERALRLGRAAGGHAARRRRGRDVVVGFGGVEVAKAFPHADLFGPLIAPGYRGQKLGSELLDASVAIAVEHGRRSVVGSVGPRNISGRLLLEHKGFHPRGPAKAVFRLCARGAQGGRRRPRGRRGAPRRGGRPRACARPLPRDLPRGGLPGRRLARRAWPGAPSTSRSGQGAPLAFLNIDPSDRWAYQIGVVAQERSRGVGRIPPLARPPGVLDGAPGRGRRPVGRGGQHPRPPAPPPPGLRALARAAVVRALALGARLLSAQELVGQSPERRADGRGHQVDPE